MKLPEILCKAIILEQEVASAPLRLRSGTALSYRLEYSSGLNTWPGIVQIPDYPVEMNYFHKD